VSDLERALEDLEASLAAVWEQADAEYVARHYPWHPNGDRCDQYPDHVHAALGRIYYWPDQITIHPPDEAES